MVERQQQKDYSLAKCKKKEAEVVLCAWDIEIVR